MFDAACGSGPIPAIQRESGWSPGRGREYRIWCRKRRDSAKLDAGDEIKKKST
jgi:hypothetical protein